MHHIKSWQERVYPDSEATYEDSPYSKIAALEAEVAELRELIKQFGNVVERLAFQMPPPNEYTPQFVMVVSEVRTRVR